MTTTKKIVLAIAALIIVGLLVVVGVTGGALGEVKCMDCHGTGLVEDAECTHCDAETHMITCPKCDGASVVEGVNCDACKNAGEVDCPYCKDGVIATAPCETCGGSGKVAGSPWALLPPIIAIALALITKEVYSSLFIGIITGALMYTNFDVLKTVDTVVNDGLISAVSATAGIFIFLIELGVIVALVNKAGGSAAFGKWAARHIKTRTGAMLATFVLGVLILLALKKYCNVETAAWLHVVTGLVTMVMAFGVMMPQLQDRFSVKTIAKTYVAAEKDASRVLYIDKFLRPGFMLYTDIPGIEADTNSEKSLDAVKQDNRPKYIVMREFMYNKMKDKMGGEEWELLENKAGICIYRSR